MLDLVEDAVDIFLDLLHLCLVLQLFGLFHVSNSAGFLEIKLCNDFITT
jgi:hypothetical protein